MHLEIVSHCWNYASLLNYQLSSLVLYAPSNVKITMTVFYSESDLMTERVLNYFGDFDPPNVNWNWQNLEVPNLMRRAIGRNMAAMESSADWIWFADADMCFRESCLDSLAEILTGEALSEDTSLVYPKHIHISRSHSAGDDAIEAVRGTPQVADIATADYVPKRYRRAIGGVQIVRGDVARAHGYCSNIRRYMRPAHEWQATREDVAFRRQLGTRGVAISVPNITRIRHSTRGQDEPGVVH